jgi:hypothetical protein
MANHLFFPKFKLKKLEDGSIVMEKPHASGGE